MPDEVILEVLRKKQRLAEQLKFRPYADVKETLDKLAMETAKRSSAQYAKKCEQEAQESAA